MCSTLYLRITDSVHSSIPTELLPNVFQLKFEARKRKLSKEKKTNQLSSSYSNAELKLQAFWKYRERLNYVITRAKLTLFATTAFYIWSTLDSSPLVIRIRTSKNLKSKITPQSNVRTSRVIVIKQEITDGQIRWRTWRNL